MWNGDGVQITCSRPDNLSHDIEIRELLTGLSERFEGSAPTMGDLLERLSELRSIRTNTPDESMYPRIELTPRGWSLRWEELLRWAARGLSACPRCSGRGTIQHATRRHGAP